MVFFLTILKQKITKDSILILLLFCEPGMDSLGPFVPFAPFDFTRKRSCITWSVLISHCANIDSLNIGKSYNNGGSSSDHFYCKIMLSSDI